MNVTTLQKVTTKIYTVCFTYNENPSNGVLTHNNEIRSRFTPLFLPPHDTPVKVTPLPMATIAPFQQKLFRCERAEMKFRTRVYSIRILASKLCVAARREAFIIAYPDKEVPIRKCMDWQQYFGTQGSV
jgi:hypothetical protein